MSLRGFFTNPYIESTAVLAGVTAVGLVWGHYLPSPNVDIFFMLAVLVSALRWGRRVGLFSAVVSAIVFYFCFVPPAFSFAVTDTSSLVTLAGFAAVAFAMGDLAGRKRQFTREHDARMTAEAQSRAKDEILNKIVHEMRTPLTVLMGRMQMLAEGRGGVDAFSQNMSSLQQSGRLLARLMDDLLSASRINSGKLSIQCTPMMLSPTVAAAVESMRVMADRKGVALHASIEEVGEMLGDEQRLHQIVTNLLSNAIKFTPAGGEVSLLLVHAGDDALLTVRDTGIGIPESFLPHVFDQFSQADTDEAKEGLGLGLAIVKYLVAAHGGTIFVTSDGQGCGTTFTIELPTMAAAAAAEGLFLARDEAPRGDSAWIH